MILAEGLVHRGQGHGLLALLLDHMKRIGFTSGSFDPVTNGHMDVIARAARIVDTLVIGIGVHPGKTPLFSPEEKIEMLKAETAPVAKKTG